MSFSYDAANRLATMLQGSAVTTYTSDNTGNLTEENASGSRTSYVYDNENRLTTVKFSNGTQSAYTFDGDAGLRRTAFEAGGTPTLMIWDGTDYLGEV